MYPGNPNIILYSAPQIVLHGLKYFGPLALKDRSELSDDERAELRDLATASAGGFPHLVRAVDGGQEQIGEELWTVNGPKIVALNKLANGTALAEVTEKIQNFAAPVGMDAQLRDYVELKVRNYASQVGLPEDRLDGLLKLMLDREAATDEGITVNSLKKGLPTELKSVVSTLGASTKSRKYIATILRPLEIAISDFAIEVLRGLKSYFVDEHDEEVIRMRDELQKSIVHLKALQSAGDENMGALIDKQLAKLGDIENVASTMEGVVFEYPVGSGRIYKLTGAFAMANQIIGRARRTGMTEEIGNEFSIKVSRDRQVSKPLSEWLKEIEEAKHQYTKLPRSVYEDIMNGSAIVDIVEESNAMPTVYNTILTYVNGLNEEDDAVELDIVADDEVAAIEDEDADPVGAGTVAIIPGAFKPPHAGHAEMVRAYAEEADRVIVLISKPTLRGRTLPDGTEVTAKHSKDIWDIMIGDLPNVEVYISDHASPINAAYAAVGKPEDRENAARNWENGPIQPGSNVILGASTKDGDAQRWTGAEQYVGDDLNLVPPMQSAVVCTDRMCGTAYSATDFRRLLGDPEANREELEEFVGAENLDAVLAALGLGANLEEISTTANVAGAVGARGGPWSTEAAAIKKDNKEEKERSKLVTRSLGIAENKQTVDEVIRLLMERGIMT